jgi:hypothetical protein
MRKLPTRLEGQQAPSQAASAPQQRFGLLQLLRGLCQLAPQRCDCGVLCCQQPQQPLLHRLNLLCLALLEGLQPLLCRCRGRSKLALCMGCSLLGLLCHRLHALPPLVRGGCRRMLIVLRICQLAPPASCLLLCLLQLGAACCQRCLQLCTPPLQGCPRLLQILVVAAQAGGVCCCGLPVLLRQLGALLFSLCSQTGQCRILQQGASRSV